MKTRILPRPSLRFIGLTLILIGMALSAQADEVMVMNSGGFSAAYRALQAGFEAKTGHTLSVAWGPSMGASPEAIPNRLARGEPADVVIMVGYALDGLIQKGVVRPDSKVDLADSRIGMSVKAGAAKPDIGSAEGLKAALLQAKSVCYSDSASGVYVERELFRKLGVEAELKPKARMIEKTPVAQRVASGECELGFQQVSELLPVPGADFVARLPEALQSITVFSAGIPVAATHPQPARQLIQFLASPAAREAVMASGLDPR